MITAQQLHERFVSPQMLFYFERKLAPLPADDVRIRVEELLKYLNMALHCAGPIPFSVEIDEVWHYWILQTQQYGELCAKLHGGRFLHHTSNDYELYSDPAAKERRIDFDAGIAILAAYVLNYGPFEPGRVRYWPLVTRLMQRTGWSLEKLNAWLGSTSLQRAA